MLMAGHRCYHHAERALGLLRQMFAQGRERTSEEVITGQGGLFIRTLPSEMPPPRWLLPLLASLLTVQQ